MTALITFIYNRFVFVKGCFVPFRPRSLECIMSVLGVIGTVAFTCYAVLHPGNGWLLCAAICLFTVILFGKDHT